LVIGSDVSHELRQEQQEEVDALLRSAFGGDEEVELVHNLRQSGDMAVELVKAWNGRIAGYAALSRMRAPIGWLCLAPVAVLPEFQRGALAPDGQPKRDWQIGRRLVEDILTYASTPKQIVVLGQPEFYEKCGFSRARAAGLTTPYPLEFTMLAGHGDDVPKETLVYPPAFDAEQAGK